MMPAIDTHRLALAVALLFVIFPGKAGAAPSDQDVLRLGAPAPMFVLKTMNAEKSKLRTFALKSFVGEEETKPKKVVLSFAASYCDPCRKELAELKGLKPAFDAAGVLLAVVVIDTDPEGIEVMRALTVDELGLEYPVLSDRFGVLARRYGARSLPMTVIVDREAKVEWISTGFTPDAIDRLKAQVGI